MTSPSAHAELGLDLPERPGTHCLEHLIQASATRELVVTEDIRDRRGILLVAKGQRINAGLRERLIARRLLRPLESSLAFCEELRPSEVQLAAQRELDEHPHLRQLLGEQAQPVMAMLARARTLGAPGTLLTTLGQTRPAAFSHAVRVAMLVSWLAALLSRSDAAMREAAEVGLLHDLGEMYVDPVVLEIPEAQQDFAQWRMRCVHPVISAALLGESGVYSAQQAAAAREHHERIDGSGYPVGASALSPLGRLISCAEALDGLFEREQGHAQALARMRIALRVVPGQFPRDVVDLLTERLRDCALEQAPAHDPQHLREVVAALLDGLERARDEALRLQRGGDLREDERAALQHLLLLIVGYIMAIHDSGAGKMVEQLPWLIAAPEAAEEVDRVCCELRWQLPGLRRHAALLAHRRARSADDWQPLLDALDIALPTAQGAPAPVPALDTAPLQTAQAEEEAQCDAMTDALG
ncbi:MULTISPECIES: HD domain-containing phosphohydrolase [Xanthomonas]|uniref:HD-GYP domain-containing protein n=1 Tax=Xanthomonas TaxID=338 RepID=UPI0022536130|nr:MULTISPECIES: HD domain-containing phosphohydrolase [Xanthomonas]MCW0391812.1 hypothetical protein [Xanthomonas sacchari]MDY4297225.1 HD domain-containing protein [Xanthomonas sp. LF02-5]MDY4358814.1 HD domain-containing protein [Xanthomonas sp. LF04-12]